MENFIFCAMLGFGYQVKFNFFLDCPLKHQFNSSSPKLSDTIGKQVLLVREVATLSGAIMTDKTTKLKIYIPIWPTLA